MGVAWKPTETAKYGVAIFSYKGANPHSLPLTYGEAVQIFEEVPGWYFGCSLRNRDVKGIFPQSYVYLKEVKDIENPGPNERIITKELPIVEEVTSVLREWGAIWKQTYVKKDDHLFHTARILMLELMNWRRQIISGTLTADQLKDVKVQIANKIDFGNKLLGLDLVVRDSEGNIIDVDSTGVIELYKRHQESSQRTQTTVPQDGRIPRKQSNASSFVGYSVHNLYVSIKNVVCKTYDDAEVFITLYDGRLNTFISEHFLVKWDKQGMPKDIDKLHNLSALFTDLGSQDLQRDKLFLVCIIIRVGRMYAKDLDNKKLTHGLRRAFGIAVLPIGDLMAGRVDDDVDKEHFLQLYHTTEGDFIDTIIKKCITREPEKQNHGQGIWISVQLLHGDINQIKEEHPLVINKFTAIARKQGFPDVIFPGDVRNDIYISILTGNFERDTMKGKDEKIRGYTSYSSFILGNKSANKNIQVTMEVYDAKGERVEGVISLGTGEELVSEYNSCIYYHSASPKWMETVKLCVPVEMIGGTHIRFTFKHRATKDEKDKSQRIFALSYVNLLNADGTALQDSIHDLAVYKCDTKRIEDTSYLKLPPVKSVAINSGTSPKKGIGTGGFFCSRNESFQISFQLCSTKLAQNVDLLGLLKWRSQKQNLGNILPALMKVSGEEIVKFLQDVFDALFAILMESPEQYGVMVSDAVVFCIGLLADKKYHHFRPVLDTYVKKHFSATKAYITLLSVLQQNIESAQKGDTNVEERDKVVKYFKSIEYMMKFIVRSRILSERAAPGKGRADFEASVSSLFSMVVNMMKSMSKDSLLTQGCALKYMPAVFGDLLEVFDPANLGFFAREMVEKIAPGRLPTQKLTCIHHLVKNSLFSIPEARVTMLPMVINQLRMNLAKAEELKICVDIMNDMLTTLTKTPEEVGPTDNDIAEIVSTLFRDAVQAVIRMDRNLPVVGNYVACIVCILDLMKEEHYLKYIESFPNESDLLDCLMELFLVFREFISSNVYPKDWISMTMIQNHVILRAIQYFSEAIYDKFLVGNSFKFQLWNNFFQLAVAFITQESLQLETFSEARRNKMLEKYGDIRMIIGQKIFDMWQLLGINKIQLIPGMVGHFLEMTLIPKAELRRTTIPVFFDMIECEFKNRQHFRQVESEVISQLDVLVEGGKGDEEYRECFTQILLDLFEKQREFNPPLAEVGHNFVVTIDRLLGILLDYRTVTESDENINNKMNCTVNILYFYKGIKREEMYIRYLYKLCDLHLSVENYTEAAFTLLLHAELLNWSDERIPSIHHVKYQAHTQREVKEKLYKDIIDYFDKGKTWEYGIRLCKELAAQYETETYDYVQLSKILEKQANFFDNIITSVIRPEPEYFRVGYYGLTFPKFLRNKVFIYRGNEYERLQDFMMRLKSQFPAAQYLKTLEIPGKDITDSIGQFIQVCHVDPIAVERRRFRGKAVAEQIRKFYEVNDINQFALSRPFFRGKKEAENEFAALWVERSKMMTAHSFPGILRWFEVVSSDTIELSPIENALETMRTKNKEIQSMMGRYTADLKANINPLGMLLNGVIDAAVMGGISNYEKAFFSEEYLAQNPAHASHMDALKELIVDQVDLLDQGLALHRTRAPEDLRPFHEKMEKCFKEMKQKVAPYRKQMKRTETMVRPSSIMMSPSNWMKSGSPMGGAPVLPEKKSSTVSSRISMMGGGKAMNENEQVPFRRGTTLSMGHRKPSGSPTMQKVSRAPDLVDGSASPPQPTRHVTDNIAEEAPPPVPKKGSRRQQDTQVLSEERSDEEEDAPPVPPRLKGSKDGN